MIGLKNLSRYYQVFGMNSTSSINQKYNFFVNLFISPFSSFFTIMDYKVPRITVDAVVIKNEAVLLVKRKNPPFKHAWALPGGFVNYGETTEAAVVRELREETGVIMNIIRLVGVYSDPQRDPRGHTISVVYQGDYLSGTPTAGDDAVEAKFFKWMQLPALAFDHGQILDDVMSGDE